MDLWGRGVWWAGGGSIGWAGIDGGGSMGDWVGFFFFFCQTVSSSKWTCLYTEYIFETILFICIHKAD